jgi:hypothetical protein
LSSARAYVLGENDGLTDTGFNKSYRSLGKDDKERRSEWQDYPKDPPKSLPFQDRRKRAVSTRHGDGVVIRALV